MGMRYQETSGMLLRLMSAIASQNGRMLLSLSLHLWRPTKSSRIKGTMLSYLLDTKLFESISFMMSNMIVDTRLGLLQKDTLQIYKMTVCIQVLYHCMGCVFSCSWLNSMA